MKPFIPQNQPPSQAEAVTAEEALAKASEILDAYREDFEELAK